MLQMQCIYLSSSPPFFFSHRFYSSNSSFVHGGLDGPNEGRDNPTSGKISTDPVHGQHEIHQRIMQLNFRDCKAKIRQVDAHATLDSGVVVQVKIIHFAKVNLA